jgi:hypothetical protein
MEKAMVSFVVRFVHDEPASEVTGDDDRAPPAVATWHGTIRHVQSDAERRFIRWEEALAFIAEYVDLEQGRNP